MKRIKTVFAVFVFVMLCFGGNAQNVLDRAYEKEHNMNKKFIPYTHLREADVMWHHRIWRVIDLREKANFPLYYPTDEGLKDRSSLFKIIKNAVYPPDQSTPKLTAYRWEDGDEFTIKMNALEVQKVLTSSDTAYVPSDPTDPSSPLVPKLVVDNLDPTKVKQYWMKEDWYFDKQKSVLECRCIGIMPIIAGKGAIAGVTGTFWIYFPELRPIIVKEEVFNRHNDAERLTFDDIFWKRQFSSYISAENNVYNNRLIATYKGANTIDALLESENIKEKIFNLEHDLWHF
ncbi:MAG: gliding motility protein GldN [Bacteroidia bacterium]